MTAAALDFTPAALDALSRARNLPRYPVYIPSKGRADVCLTAKFLDRDGVPFRIVVEPQEEREYASRFGAQRVLVLPFSNLGQGSIPARNWIKDHATAEGHLRHWQLDDNISGIRRMFRKRRIPCLGGPAFAAVEDFTDRYENIAISGLNYAMFIGLRTEPPFNLNCRVYSCSLVLNSIPHRWRGRYNEDADICLQVLASGWCTALVNVFLIQKLRTMTVKGGNTAELYAGDGRLKMARSLERVWPGVVKTSRRFKRPQHVVFDSWRRFDTPLIPKAGVDLDALAAAGPDEYGLALTEVKPIASPTLRAWAEGVMAEQAARAQPSPAAAEVPHDDAP